MRGPSIALLLIALCLASIAHAEGAAITGIVRWKETPLVGARVLVSGDALAEPRETNTDEEGRFAIEDLPAGSYTIDISAPGYEPHSQEETLADNERRELTLELSWSPPGIAREHSDALELAELRHVVYLAG